MRKKVLYEQILKMVKLTGPQRVLGRPGSVVRCICCSLTASQANNLKSPAGPDSRCVTVSHRQKNHHRRATGTQPVLPCRFLKHSPCPLQFWMTDPESFRARPLSALRASCSFISEPAQPAMLPRARRPFQRTPRGPEHMEAPLFESQAFRIP